MSPIGRVRLELEQLGEMFGAISLKLKEHTKEMTSVVFLHAEGLIHFLRFG
jgi:hypothetical protein